MGSKKVLPLFYSFNNQAITGTNTYVSPATFIANVDNIGCQVNFTGTPTGTLSILVSNDDETYDAITIALSQPAGSALHYALSLNQLPFQYLAFSYTNASGSGHMSINIFAKDLN